MNRTPKVKIGIVVSDFNKEITFSLLKCTLEELHLLNVAQKNILVWHVPGAYELPYTALDMAKRKKVDAVICLGCVLKGETDHDVHIANWVSLGIGLASFMTHVPILFGVLTPKTLLQAKQRSRSGPLNRGKDVAQTAVQMAQLKKRGG